MSDLGRVNTIINTGGVAGTLLITIPEGYKYVTVLNTSGYTFNIFEGSTVDNSGFLATAGARDYVCLPLMLKNPLIRNNVLIQWKGATTTDTIQVIFSREMVLIGNGPNGGVIDANQGAPAVVGNAWPIYSVVDGAAAGNAANPIRVNPTGTTEQPVSQGTAAAIDNPWSVKLSDGAAVVGTVGNPLRMDPTGVTTQPTRLNPVGAQANAWNVAVVAAGGASAIIDCQFNRRVSAFGDVNAATTINLQVSQDGVKFYIAGSQVLGGAGDFHITVETGARYARLLSTGAATITATIAAK